MDGAICVMTGMGRLCLPSCTEADPDCPAGFECGGVKATYCAPVDGICCVDGDDDGYGEGEGCSGPDCDDGDENRNPGLMEVCNGVDDDCDPLTDDGVDDSGVGVACDGSDTDLCLEGMTACTGGDVVCSDATADDVELCNNVDDDCIAGTADGSGDPAVGVACDGADGDLCEEGVTSCVGGDIACSDATGTTVDVCNGMDDDCNPATPDGADDPAVGGACDGPDADLCEEGTTSCSGGGLVCDDATGDAVELCNGIDDDCIGGTPDGSGDPAVGVACDGADSDQCAEGTTVCSGGAVMCNDTSGDDVDVCNGVDDDCDPGTADGSAEPTLGQPCDGPGDTDLCEEGMIVCDGGNGLVCDDPTSSTLDLCNGIDDDCDAGSADGSEDPAIGGTCDGGDADLCEEGVLLCMAGGPVCNDVSGDNLEVCNALDDDCDGPVDEDFDFDNDPQTCGDCSTTCGALCCGGSCRSASTTDCGACDLACADVTLVITEILIDPDNVSDAQGEWFEVLNLSAADIDLRGFVISDLGSDSHTVTSPQIRVLATELKPVAALAGC